MAHLSGSKQDLRFLENQVKTFEKEIDGVEKKLPKLTRFILPGGTELSSWFHILRTVCRRSERNVVRFVEQSTISNKQLTIIQYLNRLSDLFFTLARFYNKGKDLIV
jgi:cob(I)alamin adenosyltransferase